MLDAFIQAIIGAITALSGVTLTFWMHRRAARRNQIFNLVVTMMTALDAHRFAMWVLREDQHISGHPDRAYLARTEETRNAVTGPRLSLKLVDPGLGKTADAAVAVVYAMHDSLDLDDLKDKRLAARDAAREFERHALFFLSSAGIGVSGPDHGRDPASRNSVPAR
ncbi:hypothetical protein ACIRG5_47040 [Lentzea sp. NPDC102401]|uniref:hypothetical protein n=1 Tax=Lentzea sp. NPDC102401 TaxID=3364128 RepID=UPI0037F23F57